MQKECLTKEQNSEVKNTKVFLRTVFKDGEYKGTGIFSDDEIHEFVLKGYTFGF